MSWDADAEIKRLRQDLAAYPADLVDWEAACLKHVADLLDALEQARGEWGSLSERLTETQGRLTAAEAARDGAQAARDRLAEQLETARTELVALRAEVDAKREDAAAELAATREEAAELRRQLAARDEKLAAREKELEAERGKAAEANAAQEDARDLGQRLLQTQGSLVETRKRLSRAEQERDRLAEDGEEWGAVRAALGDAKERIAALERECDALREESEQKFMQICELRVRENRMETERDDAKRKKRKILAKVHSELDRAGAPAGEDTSFGERIRWLRTRIDELEAP